MSIKEWVITQDFGRGKVNLTETILSNGFIIDFPKDENNRPNRAWPRETMILPSQMNEEFPEGLLTHSMGYPYRIRVVGEE